MYKSAKVVLSAMTLTLLLAAPGCKDGGTDPENPTLAATPGVLTYTTEVGANPPSQPLFVENSGGGDLNFFLTFDQGWLRADLVQGTLSQGQGVEFSVHVTATGLSVGVHQGNVTITAPGADGSPTTVPVSVTVTEPPAPPGTPRIGLNPSSLSFAAPQGASPAPAAFVITNSDGGRLDWTASASQGWVSLGTTSGSLTGGQSSNVPVSINTSSLSVGTHSAVVLVSDPGASNSPQVVALSLTVTPANPTAPVIQLSTTSASFNAALGGANPTPQVVGVANGGGGTLSGLSTSVAYSGGVNGWLGVALSSSNAPANLTLSPAVSGLTTGTYTATVSVLAAGAVNSPQVVTVTLEIGGTTGGSPTIGLSRATVPLSGSVGGANPGAQVVAITNSGGGTLSGLAVGGIAYSGGASGWLSASLSGTTAPANLTLSASLAGLAAATYSATVPIQAAGATNSPQIVTVTLSVSGGTGGSPAIGLSTSAVSFQATAGSGNPPNQVVGITNVGGGTLSGLSVGSISYTGGASGWLSAVLGATVAPANLTLSANSGGLGAGTYTATVPVESGVATNSPQAVTVTLTVSGTGGNNPPAAPSLLLAKSGGPTTINLEWRDNSNNEVEFRIERKVGSGGTYTQITSVGADLTTHTDSGLTASTTYFYRIRACNPSGCSAYSNEAATTTSAS